jgi:hypothetical protein
VQAELAYDEGMAQEIGIDGAVPDGQAETRGENIFKLHPDEFGVQSFVWHWLRSCKRSGSVESLDSPGFVIPNPCAFGRVRDLLSVCPWPYPREVNRAKRSLRVEELKSSRVDREKKRAKT